MKKYFAVILSLVMMMCVVFTGCSKEVAVDVTGLEQITSDGAAVGKTGEAYTATLTAADHYELPETITVTVDGTALSGGYSYDAKTGMLTIEGESITGDVAIAAVAEESIVGVWKSSMDLSEYMNDILSADPSTAGYFEFADIKIDFIMTFNGDGTFSLVGDEASLTAMIENLKVQMKDGMIKMFEDLLGSTGMDMTVDELLAASGVSLDDMIDQSLDSISPESLVENMENEGKYKVENGNLYLADASEEDFAQEDAQAFEIKDGVMTLQVSEGDKGEEMMDVLFPMILERVD